MNKLICKLFGHYWHKIKIDGYVPYRKISLFRYCVRCHKREEYAFSMMLNVYKVRWTPMMYKGMK